MAVVVDQAADHDREFENKEEMHRILQPAMEDLACRFLINMPSEELASADRIGFLLEEAHWFYMDMYQEQQNLPRLTFTAFVKHSVSNKFVSC